MRTADDGWRAMTAIAVETALTEKSGLIAEYFDAAAAEKTVPVGVRGSASSTADIDFVAGHSRDAVDESGLGLGLNLAS
jgi:hypothetical protein